MPKNTIKTTTFGIRVTSELYRRIKRAAKYSKRTPSDWARVLVEEAIEAFEREHPERLGHQSSGPKGEKGG